jgi:hypothetical protein
MLTEVSPTNYVVKIGNRVVSTPQPSYSLAEATLLTMVLTESERAQARIVPVDGSTGKDILFG